MDSERRQDKRVVDGAKKYWWAAAIAVPLAGAAIGVTPSILKKESPSISISRDSHALNFRQINVIEQEYRQKTGQVLPPEIRQQIEQALQSIHQEQYEDGIPLLRAAAEKAPVASVLTDLGHALAMAGKSTEARDVYARAAAVDPTNQQVTEGRQFLATATRNNTILTAAEIPMQKVISATLLDGDTHFFKFTAPSGPRDHVRVRLQNRSTNLGLALGVRDSAKAPIGDSTGAVAADISYEFAATPGATHYLQVSPYYSGGGSYTLTVEPAHRFDGYEPNDTILTAKEVPPGTQIEANIMDSQDTDFYQFRARGGKTVVVVENRSTTLGIGLAITDADKAPVGGQTGSVAANIRYEFESKAGSVYHLQISPYYSQSGKYAFTIQ